MREKMEKVADEILKVSQAQSYSDRYGDEAVSNERIVYDRFTEVLEELHDEYGRDITEAEFKKGTRSALRDFISIRGVF